MKVQKINKTMATACRYPVPLKICDQEYALRDMTGVRWC